MKFYQCRNSRKYYYTIIFSYIIGMGLSTIFIMGDSVLIVDSQEYSGMGLLFFTLIGVGALIYLRIIEYFKRTVEVTEEGIICREKRRTVKIEWDDISRIFLYPRYKLSYNRLIFFLTDDCTNEDLAKRKINSRLIFSEYNDLMLEDVKKYWGNEIINEEMYLKYKRKKERKNYDGY